MARKEITLPKCGDKLTIRRKSFYEILAEDLDFDYNKLFETFESLDKVEPVLRRKLVAYKVKMACEMVMEFPKGRAPVALVPKDCPPEMVSFYDYDPEDQNFLIAEVFNFFLGGEGGNAGKFPEKQEAGNKP